MKKHLILLNFFSYFLLVAKSQNLDFTAPIRFVWGKISIKYNNTTNGKVFVERL
jgi:hypothetical protein